MLSMVGYLYIMRSWRWNNSRLMLHSSSFMPTFFLHCWWDWNFMHGILSLSLIDIIWKHFFAVCHEFSCSVFQCLEIVIKFPIFIFYFYWSYNWDIWIDALHVCMCPLLHFQMLIQRLNHHSMRGQHHLLGFKYCNHVSRLPWMNSLKWDHELWTEDNSRKTVYRICVA